MHSIICIFAMLALSVALAVGYGCDRATSMDLAVRGFMHPLAACLNDTAAARGEEGGGRRGGAGGGWGDGTVECARTWQDRHMPAMLRQFERADQPIVFLQLGGTGGTGGAGGGNNMTLHGDALAYRRLFRRYPRSFKLRAYDLFAAQDVGSPGSDEGQAEEEEGGAGENLAAEGDGAATLRETPPGYTVEAHIGAKAEAMAQSTENLWTVASVLCVFVVLSLAFSGTMKHQLIDPLMASHHARHPSLSAKEP
jgi:hypothetical protein